MLLTTTLVPSPNSRLAEQITGKTDRIFLVSENTFSGTSVKVTADITGSCTSSNDQVLHSNAVYAAIQ